MNVLVLGGAGGIGSAVCRELADGGHRPIAVDCAPAEHNWIEADLRDDTRVAAIVGELASRFGGADALVNCAGVYEARTLETFSWEDFEESFRVNVHAPLRVILEWCASRNGGALVNVTSAAARSGSRDLSYSVSKAAMEGATRSLALSLVPRGFRVFAIAPHVVDTPMSRAMPEARRLEQIGRALIAQPCPPGEVAALVGIMLSGPVDHLVGTSVNLSAGALWT
jgi:NAD(P)-dependent dehydrogenase (short-subunit alcohol dehydrogenase family)